MRPRRISRRDCLAGRISRGGSPTRGIRRRGAPLTDVVRLEPVAGDVALPR